MKKRAYLNILIAAVMMLTAACTNAQAPAASAPAETSAPAASQAPSETAPAAAAETTAAATQPDTAAETTAQAKGPQWYQSSRGWSVCYDPGVIELREGQDQADFVYIPAPQNVLSICYASGQQPEEAMSRLTEAWNSGEPEARTESYFPGTEDKWGYWRSYSAPKGSGLPSRTLIGGEYNGGALVFDIISCDDGKTDMMELSDHFSEIINSIRFEYFEPQTMYDYVPGRYVRTDTEMIGRQQVTAERAVTLNEDHTGTMSMQDDVPIRWGSYQIWTEDGGLSCEYTIEGDSLMLQYDGQWLSFEREGAGGLDPVASALMPTGPQAPVSGAHKAAEARPAVRETLPAESTAAARETYPAGARYGARDAARGNESLRPTASQSGGQAASGASISQEEALQIALRRAGLDRNQVTWQQIKQDYERGRLVYEIQLNVGRMEYEFDIDTRTGEILKYEVDRD